MIRNVKETDIKILAPIYKELYDNADIGEYWTIESAEKLLNYWYVKQKDLFLVAEENNEVVGAIMSGIKPWFDGNRLIDSEVFVSSKYQGKHIAKDLFLILKKPKNCTMLKLLNFILMEMKKNSTMLV